MQVRLVGLRRGRVFGRDTTVLTFTFNYMCSVLVGGQSRWYGTPRGWNRYTVPGLNRFKSPAKNAFKDVAMMELGNGVLL